LGDIERMGKNIFVHFLMTSEKMAERKKTKKRK
jgi:hypothetical protein